MNLKNQNIAISYKNFLFNICLPTNSINFDLRFANWTDSDFIWNSKGQGRSTLLDFSIIELKYDFLLFLHPISALKKFSDYRTKGIWNASIQSLPQSVCLIGAADRAARFFCCSNLTQLFYIWLMIRILYHSIFSCKLF